MMSLPLRVLFVRFLAWLLLSFALSLFIRTFIFFGHSFALLCAFALLTLTTLKSLRVLGVHEVKWLRAIPASHFSFVLFMALVFGLFMYSQLAFLGWMGFAFALTGSAFFVFLYVLFALDSR